jgi:hypothetical protein
MSVTVEEIVIPAVCTTKDLARILKWSLRTVQSQVANGTFPIPALDATGGPRRWGGEAVRRYLEGQTEGRRFRRIG